MRKLLLALLAVLALFAGGCSSSGDEETGSATTAAAPDGGDGDGTTTTGSEEGDGDEGGDEEPASDLVEVEAWADNFCGDFQAWLDGVKAASEGLSGSIAPGDIEGAKAAIVDLFDDVAGQTETLITEIEDGGAPDIDDGEQFLADLLTKFEEFHTAITDAGAEAEAVDTADPAAFQATITELVSTFQAETETVGNSFSELDARYPDQDLNAAVTSSCSFA